MRLLVTGGSGFIGRALVNAALHNGFKVAVLARNAAHASPPGAIPIPGDLAAPPWDTLAGFAPDAVVHAAWIATPGIYLDSPANTDWLHWSRAFGRRLPDIGVRHLTVLGTCIEYAITGRPMDEIHTPIAPASPYARAKAALHDALRSDLADGPVQLAWARLFYPYGTGEHPGRLASSLLTRIRLGEPLTLRTPHSTKDYIHVDDAARALLAVLHARFQGPVNIGTGEGVTVETVARTVARLAGRPDLVLVPAGTRPDPLDYVVADATRIHSLGWKPQVALVDGLRALVEARGA